MIKKNLQIKKNYWGILLQFCNTFWKAIKTLEGKKIWSVFIRELIKIKFIRELFIHWYLKKNNCFTKVLDVIKVFFLFLIFFWRGQGISKMRGLWCNGYCRRKWTRRLEFKSWTRLIAFHIALIPLGKVWIQLFSLQLWVNSRADGVLQPWWGN